MSYHIEFSPVARKTFLKLPRQLQQRILQKINILTTNPRPADCKKLQNSENYRIRIGEWRIIYRVEDNILLITLLKIGHRREVYR
jgi:mRNA interferase RelE/StbE